MKKLFFALIGAVTFFNVSNAQNDTMYVMKAGAVVAKYNVNTQVDSVIFYKPQSPTSGTYTDTRDGNVYQWVKIGNQIWMAENLKYLPSVIGSATGSTTNAYCYVHGYNGTVVADAKATANFSNYGVLYNWPAAMAGSASSSANPSGIQGVCPTGWHLPGDAEWTQLINYLGGDSEAGGKLKEIGTTHWTSPNTGASNLLGFTALPGGYRSGNGTFRYVGNEGFWWSAKDGGVSDAWARDMIYNYIGVIRYYGNKELGFSVRCVRD